MPYQNVYDEPVRIAAAVPRPVADVDYRDAAEGNLWVTYAGDPATAHQVPASDPSLPAYVRARAANDMGAGTPAQASTTPSDTSYHTITASR